MYVPAQFASTCSSLAYPTGHEMDVREMSLESESFDVAIDKGVPIHVRDIAEVYNIA